MPEKTTNVGTKLLQDKKERLTQFLMSNVDVFAWSHINMLGIKPAIVVHRLNVDLEAKPVRQKNIAMDVARNIAAIEEVGKMLKVDFIREVQY